MSNVLVLGGSGFLGQSLGRLLGSRGFTTYNSCAHAGGIAFDATQVPLRHLLAKLPKTLSHVIVTYGAINPELCAKDPVGTAKINVTSVIKTMRDAMDAGITPVFLSTDYVYDGTQGNRREHEVTCPTTQYGIQKVAVENWLGETSAPWIIARASKLVSGAPDTHSVLGQWIDDIKAGREMRCADDQIFSPAFVDDVATAVIRLLETDARGIFHVAGEQAMSRYDLASTLIDAVGQIAPDVETKLIHAKLGDFPFLERRPLNTSLSSQKLHSLGLHTFRRMDDLCKEIAQAAFK